MKNSPLDHKDPQLTVILKSVGPGKAPVGLADKLMRSVEAAALRRKRVQKNLSMALVGVGSTLALMLAWLVGGNVWVAEIIPQSLAGQAELNSAMMLSVTGLGMIALFVEVEIVVRYWWQWRRLQLRA